MEQIIETVRLVPWRGELHLRTRAGREVVLSVTFSLLKEGKKKSGGVLGCAKDFTELRRLGNEKDSEEARSWGLLERIPCSLFALPRMSGSPSGTGKRKGLSPLSTGRAAGMGLEEILGRENGERMRELMGRASSAQGQVETQLRLVDRHQQERILRVRAAVLDTGEGERSRVRRGGRGHHGDKGPRNGQAIDRGDHGVPVALHRRRCQSRRPGRTSGRFPGRGGGFHGSRRGAVYRIEDDYMELTSFRGYSEGFAKKAGRLRIRPNRMEVLEAQAGLLLTWAVIHHRTTPPASGYFSGIGTITGRHIWRRDTCSTCSCP